MKREVLSQWWEDQVFRIASKGKTYKDPNNLKLPHFIKIKSEKGDVTIPKNTRFEQAISHVWNVIRPHKTEDSGYLSEVQVLYPEKAKVGKPKYSAPVERLIRTGKIKETEHGLRGPGGRFISPKIKRNKKGKWYSVLTRRIIKGL